MIKVGAILIATPYTQREFWHNASSRHVSQNLVFTPLSWALSQCQCCKVLFCCKWGCEVFGERYQCIVEVLRKRESKSRLSTPTLNYITSADPAMRRLCRKGFQFYDFFGAKLWEVLKCLRSDCNVLSVNIEKASVFYLLFRKCRYIFSNADFKPSLSARRYQFYGLKTTKFFSINFLPVLASFNFSLHFARFFVVSLKSNKKLWSPLPSNEVIN